MRASATPTAARRMARIRVMQGSGEVDGVGRARPTLHIDSDIRHGPDGSLGTGSIGLVPLARASPASPAWLISSIPQVGRQANTAVDKAHSEVRLAELAQDDDRHRRARAQYVKTLEQLAEVLDLFVDAGLRPPPLHPEVVADLRGAGAVRHPEALRVRNLLDWELEDHRG